MATINERRALLAEVLRLQRDSKADEARALLQRLMIADDAPMLPLLRATTLPHIYPSAQSIEMWRNRSIQELRDLHRRGFAMDLTQALAIPWFALAYQGQNDRESQELLASLYRAPQQRSLQSERQRRADRKLRIGIISAYFREKHTIGKLSRGLIANLNRDEFFVTAFSCGNHEDEVTMAYRNHCSSCTPILTRP